jgi:hypothetical protein
MGSNKKGKVDTSPAAAAPASPPAPAAPSGAPRWTYAVGAIVGAVGLVWGIVSSFIPKPGDAAKAAPAATQPTTSVTVSGSGNVGVGNNSGTINIGAPAPATPPASTSRP